jgi:hypothetical protein
LENRVVGRSFCAEFAEFVLPRLGKQRENAARSRNAGDKTRRFSARNPRFSDGVVKIAARGSSAAGPVDVSRET